MKTFEYKLRPTKKQAQRLAWTLEATRLLYNQCLEEVRKHYADTGEHLHRFAQARRHTTVEHPGIPSVVINTTIQRLHRSYDDFFRRHKRGERAGHPRFKNADRWSSFELKDGCHGIEGSYFKSGKACVGNVRLRLSRQVEGTVKRARVVRRPSGWYVQFICVTTPTPLPNLDNAVGLDFGIKNLVADSNGAITIAPRKHQVMLKRLRRAQRKIARRTKGSARRRKAIAEIRRLHERIANQRRDHLHCLSRHYINNFGTVVVEDLQIQRMVRNPIFAFHIHDAAWGMLRHMLSYKAEDAGRTLIAVPPHFTSQQCSNCREMVQKSLSVRTHTCPECGYNEDRDVNAAKNILRLGLSLRSSSQAIA